jgi:excisionase family DNA binding protein
MVRLPSSELKVNTPLYRRHSTTCSRTSFETWRRAAELLGMSRPYLIRLLDAGEMRYHLVGKHRRIALCDVLSYSKRRAEGRRAALDKMARDAFEAGLYDNATIPEGASDE